LAYTQKIFIDSSTLEICVAIGSCAFCYHDVHSRTFDVMAATQACFSQYKAMFNNKLCTGKQLNA
jgi:hypothetical protein